MGKRIISRARGAGGPRYRSPGHRFAGQIKYPKDGKAVVEDIIHDPCRDAPLAKLKMENKNEFLIVAAEGLKVGDKIEIGKPSNGSIVPLSIAPKSAYVFGIEMVPFGGPKICCSAGTAALIISHEADGVVLQLPSKAFKKFNLACRATVGYPAGGGMGDKPFIKAGQAFFHYAARNKLWPRTSGCKMNPVDHPFGGKTKPGGPKSCSRNAPPGAKVGSIASRRTGVRR